MVPILLIMDNHSSHVTAELIELAITNHVVIIMLIPHTTHRMQPLDVSVFGPLQRRWLKESDRVAADPKLLDVDRSMVVYYYLHARQMGINAQNIHTGWQKTGLYPCDPTVFTDNDF